MITPGWFAAAMTCGLLASLIIGIGIGYSHGRRAGIIVERYKHRTPEADRLRAALQWVLEDEPNGVPRALSHTRKYIAEVLGVKWP